VKNVITLLRGLKGDQVIWAVIALLYIFSLVSVYSAAGSMAFKDRNGDTEYYLLQQFVFVVMGAILIYICYNLEYHIYARLAPFLILITFFLLAYTLFFGDEVNQARRWITIPFIDKTFQPSDLAEISLILFVARALATKQDKIKDFKGAFLPILMPIILICMLIVPANLSTGVLLFFTCVILMFIGRVAMKYIFGLVLIGGMVGFLIYQVGKKFPEFVRAETWETRVTDFLGSSDEVFQVQQAKIAIASGGIIGVGPGKSIQRNHLPYAYADCIYAIICEEYGIIGGLIVLCLYLVLLIRCINIVIKSPKAFGALLAMGLCLNIVVQAFANISVSVQLVPATGLTLPLISMGGTSMLLTSISLGIILCVSKHAELATLERMALEKQESLNNLNIANANNH
jgi:cell division protein FtsW